VSFIPKGGLPFFENLLYPRKKGTNLGKREAPNGGEGGGVVGGKGVVLRSRLKKSQQGSLWVGEGLGQHLKGGGGKVTCGKHVIFNFVEGFFNKGREGEGIFRGILLVKIFKGELNSQWGRTMTWKGGKLTLGKRKETKKITKKKRNQPLLEKDFPICLGKRSNDLHKR